MGGKLISGVRVVLETVGGDGASRAARALMLRLRLLRAALRLAHARAAVASRRGDADALVLLNGRACTFLVVPRELSLIFRTVPMSRDELAKALSDSETETIVVEQPGRRDTSPNEPPDEWYRLDEPLLSLPHNAALAARIFCDRVAPIARTTIAASRDAFLEPDEFDHLLRTAVAKPSELPSLHRLYSRVTGRSPAPPFDLAPAPASQLPVKKPRERRGVLFVNNNYYHFVQLAQGLRRRGWDAVVLSVDSPESPNELYYHGQDLRLWDADPARRTELVRAFFEEIPERFGLVHFYGRDRMSLFGENFAQSSNPRPVPWDFLELRRRGVKIAYTPTGCNDGVSQSAVSSFTGMCEKCAWRDRPDVCSDAKNLEWGRVLEHVCDLVCPELDWPLEARTGEKYFREPLTTAVDPDLWHPDIEVPEDWRMARAHGELIVYHAVGNYDTRRVGDRDIKGTGAVIGTIERLRAEGLPVTLKFVTNVPSRMVRFIQVQADIIVDQLNYGRYGANAREAMMLGKPTICYVDQRQPAPLPPSVALSECPLVSATETTLYDVLKDLLTSPQKRRQVGEASRAFALKWHSTDACAARYEEVYDRLMAGLSFQPSSRLAAAE